MIVVAVEYLNTLPFIYGIEHAADQRLRKGLLMANPAQCAELAADRKADIALVPVGALSSIGNPQIITSYCLSTSGAVRTVVLLTDTPIDQLETIYLDSHSRTSVELAKILAAEKWKISPRYIDNIPKKIENGEKLNYGEAIVAIGDKVFALEDHFSIKIDLSDHWREMTHLPFVFAVWVALTAEGLAAEQALNQALSYGVGNIERALPDDPLRPRNLHYLTRSIEYELTDQKRQAMQLFLSKINRSL